MPCRHINLLLLAFNLLPALPLDGGRVLRSALWQARRDFGRATRVATGIGRAFASAFIVGGIALLIVHGAFGGAWLAFIGWFLLQAANAESQHLLVREVLGGRRSGR
jgi:Zn-dependent protease